MKICDCFAMQLWDTNRRLPREGSINLHPATRAPISKALGMTAGRNHMDNMKCHG
ncbi:hypothetical protein SAMN04488498_103361 [Mesorhizobium albiziae]|uniref:Uncharacterized protein n=1 Tax=Neomesorhizobium albiziae TaxID=335020 RepID=A0A1I3XNF6_9HYPH|nr:hypothetical protein SAMN04488498_103361 [Mesorhizobium albiziae]